jgi:DNA-binding SARP family transcriptional activator/energy-coupling factor transporter ATP-binding protein EcfA2
MPTIQLFGIPRITSPGRADLPLSAREAGLLAWLHLEGPSPRGRIAGLLWPGGDESQARANLRQALVRLKRSAGELLEESAGVMRLAADVMVLPAAADDSSPAASRLLGPLEFDDAPEFSGWLQARRDAADRERRRQHLAAARQHLEAGALDAALAAAEAVLATDPAVEEAHRLRMEALYLRGDRAAAITAWDDCRDALRTAYGITPSAATNELGRLVLAAEAAGQQQAAAAKVHQGVTAAVLPAALRRPPLLVGRDGVLDEIASAFALGHGVVVAGPGGIGKSRLLAQAAVAMEPAIQVGGRPGDEHLPGVVASRLVAAAIERFAPDLDSVTRADIALLLPGGPARGQALQSALEHRRVLASVARTMLACHAKGMRLVVVDDLHFADDLSMEAIAVVVGGWLAQPPDSAALPLFGCRPDELRPAAAALVQIMDGSARSVRIDLAALSVVDIQALLASLPMQADGATSLDRQALAQALHARVGGNPAFVLESIKALWLGGLAGWQPGQALAVPATLKESLRQRLARLGHEAMQLAQLAAVAQEDFSLSLAAAATGRAPLALAPLFAELEAAQVLDGVRFSHDLVAEAARASLPAALVAPLHRLVADHLRAQGGAAARVAWHLQHAGAEVEAVPWHLATARAARERWQLADAARSFEAAARGLERQARERGAHGAVQPAGEATDSVALTWLQSARWWTAVSDYAAALRALEHGLMAASTVAERLELHASRVVVLLNSLRVEEATAQALLLAHELQSSSDALPAERLAAALFACVAVAPHTSELQRLAELCETLRSRCESGPPRAQQSFHLSVGTCLNWWGRPISAEADLNEARTLADGFGDFGAVVNVTHQQLRNALMLGRTANALAAAEDCHRAVRTGGYGRSFLLHAWAAKVLVGVAAGRPEFALAALQGLQQDTEGADLRSEPEVAAAQAVGWWFLGRGDLAAQGLPSAEGWLALAQLRLSATERERSAALASAARHWPAADGVMGCRQRILTATLHTPPLAEAERLVDDLQQRGLLPLCRQAHGLAAQAALAAGASESALMHARQSLAMETAVDPWTDEPAAPWLRAAAVLRAAGAPSEADEALARGRAWLLAAAGRLPDAAAQRLFLQGHAPHRELMER